MAGRPGRKQEVSVVVVGTGGEQKDWSRLEGKWVWWASPPISQMPTDHKQIGLVALKRETELLLTRTDLRVDPQ